MSKRKQTHDMDVDGDDDSDDEQTPTLVDVNFDYYNVNSATDYHAIKRLFTQLFGPDAERVQTGPLTELVTTVAEENGVGSTIKTEEEEGSDPYAVLTAISCRDHPGLQGLMDYVLSRTSADGAFHAALSSLLRDPSRHVGLVLSERLVNMPVQVMAPMYRMLWEELDEAIKEGQAYDFTHYLFVSRVYRLTAEDEAAMFAQRDSKRHRTMSNVERKQSKDGVYGFHPEDEEITQHATHTATYGFADAQPRDGESLGLDLGGRAMLVPAEKWKGLVEKIGETYAVGEGRGT